MNKITFIIVDCQYDFIDGSLAVPNAHNAINNIVNFIKEHKEVIDKVIFTLDWHPKNHCSFKDYGGQWPNHCIQYTEGAAIDTSLVKTILSNNIPDDVILKGIHKDKEEYGAFSIHPLSDTLFDELHSCHINPDIPLVVCGIAGDYCVKETLKNLLRFKPKVFLNGIASIDDGSIIKKFIEENNLEVVE